MAARVEIRGLKEVRSMLSGINRGADIALSRSINRALTTGRKVASQEIRKELNVKAADAKNQIQIYKANPSKPTGWIEAKGKPLAFSTSKWLRFSGKKVKKGYAFTIKKGRGRKKFKNAFEMRFKSGHIGIFVRTGSGAGAGKRTAGLKELYTTRIPDVLENEDVNKRVRDAMADQMEKELTRQAQFLIEKG